MLGSGDEMLHTLDRSILYIKAKLLVATAVYCVEPGDAKGMET